MVGSFVIGFLGFLLGSQEKVHELETTVFQADIAILTVVVETPYCPVPGDGLDFFRGDFRDFDFTNSTAISELSLVVNGANDVTNLSSQ